MERTKAKASKAPHRRAATEKPKRGARPVRASGPRNARRAAQAGTVASTGVTSAAPVEKQWATVLFVFVDKGMLGASTALDTVLLALVGALGPSQLAGLRAVVRSGTLATSQTLAAVQEVCGVEPESFVIALDTELEVATRVAKQWNEGGVKDQPAFALGSVCCAAGSEPGLVLRLAIDGGMMLVDSEDFLLQDNTEAVRCSKLRLVRVPAPAMDIAWEDQKVGFWGNLPDLLDLAGCTRRPEAG